MGCPGGLSEELHFKLDEYFKKVTGIDSQEIEINNFLENMADQRILRDNDPLRRELNEDYELIKRLIGEFQFEFEALKKIGMKIGRFGSLVNGFGTSDSDLDITILTNCYVDEKKFIEILGNFLEFKLSDNVYKVISLTNAKIPIVQIKREREEPQLPEDR